jgi:hypothetical protein
LRETSPLISLKAFGTAVSRALNAKAELPEIESRFILIHEKEVLRRIRKLIETTQKSLEVITTSNRFQSGVFSFYEVDKKALKRGVTHRIIVDKPCARYENLLKRTLEVSTENTFFEIRYVKTSPLAVMAIFDKIKMFIAISATAAIGEVPILVSNNPSLVAVTQSYFEKLWSTALKCKPEQPWYSVALSFRPDSVIDGKKTDVNKRVATYVRREKRDLPTFVTEESSVIGDLSNPIDEELRQKVAIVAIEVDQSDKP